MFKLTATFFALLDAALAVSIASNRIAPIASSGSSLAPTPDAIFILTTCDDLNLTGFCNSWTSTVLPTGCGDLVAAGQQNSLTSVSTADGLQCTLFADEGCTGRSQIIVGTVNDLRTVGFDDTANSFNCQST